MAKPMRMKCTISRDLESSWMWRVNAVLFDDTPLSFKTEQHNVELNEEITPTRKTVQGWVNVTHVAQQGSQVHIALPSPSIEFGKNVHVNQLVLMPLGLSIEHFNSQKIEAPQSEPIETPVQPKLKPKKARKNAS